MKKIFCLNYFCLALVFMSIIFLTGCFSTPEGTLQEFKKAMDAKDGEKMWSLLSSNDHKFYEKIVAEEKANVSKNPDHIKNMGLTQEELTKMTAKDLFVKMMKASPDSPNAGKELEIRSVTKSKDKAVIFVENNPNGFTLIKENGFWKVSMVGEAK